MRHLDSQWRLSIGGASLSLEKHTVRRRRAPVYPLTNVGALVAVVVIGWFTAGLVSVIAIPLLLITPLGLVSLVFLSQERSRTLGVSKGWAAAAYIIVVLLANAVYMPFAVSYARLVGAS